MSIANTEQKKPWRRNQWRKFKKLYEILHELDCELQMLGARGDWGIQPTPDFARETLVASLTLLSQEPEASKGYLVDSAQELIDFDFIQDGRFSDIEAAEETNDDLFAKLLANYWASRVKPSSLMTAGEKS